MEYKKENPIVAIKLKNGDDVIGYYMGDITIPFTEEQAIVVHRPVKIQLLNSFSEGGVSTNYIPSLYFPYGETTVHFLISQIVQQATANSFFGRFYENILGELVLNEEVRHMRMDAVFDEMEERTILKNTTSAYVEPETNTLQ